MSRVLALVCACAVSFRIDWHNDTVFDISFENIDTPLIMHNVGVAFSESGLGMEGIGQLPNGRPLDGLEAKDYTVWHLTCFKQY